MSGKNKVRKEVSEFYARSVTAGTGCCCGPTLPKGVAAPMAGYGTELEGLPSEAAENSFGCGNPLAMAEVKPGQTVLDLGSGAGLDLLIAARRVGPTGRVIGVDMTDEMISRALQTVREAGLTNVEVRKGIIEELPVADASVDWVISNCVINLSPEKDRVFSEIARVLRPGGSISISDIVARDLPETVRADGTLYASCISGAIPEEEYCEGLRFAGLSDVVVLERLVYDHSQLGALVGASAHGQSCCGGPANLDVDEKTLASMEGNVWSARFSARKEGHK